MECLKKSHLSPKIPEFTVLMRLPGIPTIILGFFLVFTPIGAFSQNSLDEEPTSIEKWFYPVTTLSKSATKMLRTAQEEQDPDIRSEAVALFEKAFTDNPADGIVAYNLANAYQLHSKFAQAEEMYRLALENSGYSIPPAHTDDTRSYLAQLRRANSEDRAYLAKIFFNQGNNYFKQEKFLEALTSYKYSLATNPNDLNTKHNFELTLEKLEENASSEATNPKSEQNEPNPNQESNNNNDNANNEDSDNPGSQEQQNDQANKSADASTPNANNKSSKEKNTVTSQGNADNDNNRESTDPDNLENPQGILSLERAEQILDGYQNRQKKFETYKKYPQKTSRDPNHKNW